MSMPVCVQVLIFADSHQIYVVDLNKIFFSALEVHKISDECRRIQ